MFKFKILFFTFWLLQFSYAHGQDYFWLKNPYGEKIKLSLALTKKEQTKGLSGLTADRFSDLEGMLFVNKQMAPRRCWMPDTFFNLDILFLDQSLKIVAIEKNVPAHPGLKEPPEIYQTGTYIAQYVLETKASSPFNKKLKINDVLVFSGPRSLSEIILRTHPEQ